ncbi:GTPase Era [Flavobacteriaceae bacterium]|nr:GTPase Era [Flavobacteriaceae bacterium]MDA9125015.1 GTPase Era [Flavobacteriaceae bacterium]MDC0117494.1 GTPase Era [Flavobacteriaceae bacterium]
MHKSSFVNIIGNPNVGKSSLTNFLLGQKLSIITSKAQTTRHRILALINDDDFQLVISDTPGIIKPAHKLHKSMMDFVLPTTEDADILLYMVEYRDHNLKDDSLFNKIVNIKVPLLIIINKIDLIDQEKLDFELDFWKNKVPNAEIWPISVKESFNIDKLLDRLVELSPESPPYFPKDQLTDKSERFFVNEIIREKILLNFKKEIPYSVEVVTEDFFEEETIIKIRSIIIVERDSQKGIIIGHKGAAIKKVGTQARIDIEKFFNIKIFLDLQVKVNKNWRSDENQLKKFGYHQK